MKINFRYYSFDPLLRNRELTKGDRVFLWARRDYSPDRIEGLSDSLEDISFARRLESNGFGILAKKFHEEVYHYPPIAVFSDRLIATAMEIELFVKNNRLQFGNESHIALRDAYTYLKLFEKYQKYNSLRR
jgi:hypothetical protein